MQVGEGGKTKEEDCVEEQSSQTPGATPKSTPKKRKAPSSLVDDSSPSKKKPAPAEKVTSSQRVVILEGLNQPAVYKSVDMNKLATSFGGDVTAPKLVRHWREVLFFDLKAFFSGEAAKKSLGKASMGPEVRKGLWQAMVQACDKVDWKVVEERTGLSASKLKRHLRESMRKEGERFIAH
ncbi:hypothetical protein BCR39DRAFT_81678 [Naematelia encephala]|uniref:Uncharacterized protein n=1 Tax=Naematelia encephala TaxID=71784 RepID=A0A1Y2BAD6_9TREE|nr:hypothetical protein BCR39DRAFT_81678 [Naematelia encephala]